MRIATQLPHGVSAHDHVLIPMRDGVRLSARIWLPADAADHPVPALLEYLPYRKGDFTAVRDAQRHPWYAGHGYASVRVDLRGSGDSEGVMRDEYSPTELDDGVAVIEWLARQPWCTGKVGMFGISWGGFNALQVAALRPPPLAAIVTVCSSADRYANDVHYFGGAVLGIDMLAWATTMLAFTARPPDPARVGDRWRELWEQRLDALDPFLDTWLSHQERDAYWRRGSVCEDFAAIESPVLAVGGWADPYRDTVFQLVQNLSCPVKGIVGPWPHQYPDIERPPGPAIGFLQETLRWWDHWLKDRDTGVTAEPALRVWMQESVRPATSYPSRPGRWLGEPSWPSPNVADERYPFTGLHCLAGVGKEVLVSTPQHTGVDAGRYFPFGNPADLPPDQREEDGRSVCFDTAPLTQPVEVLGAPSVRLTVRATDAANVVVRVCDVAPDGSSTLVTRGCLNLLKRDGMHRATPVPADDPLHVAVCLVGIAWRFPAGHRIRIAVSTTYWPWVWPHPTAPPVHLNLAGSELVLPVRRGSEPDGDIHFDEAEQATPLAVASPGNLPSAPPREVRYLPQTREWRLTVDPDYGSSRTYADGLTVEEHAHETYTIQGDDPLSAVASSTWEVRLQRANWDVSIQVRGELRSEPNAFLTEHDLTARVNGEPAFERSWRSSIPRTST